MHERMNKAAGEKKCDSEILGEPLAEIRAEHGLGSVGLKKKFYQTEPNQVEENSTRCQPFIIYKSFETEVNSLQQIRMGYASLGFNVDPMLI